MRSTGEENQTTGERVAIYCNVASPQDETARRPALNLRDCSNTEEDDYVNEGLVVRNSALISRAQSPVAVVISESQENSGPNAVVDFGEGDFTFVDPKALSPNDVLLHHSSVSNLNTNRMPSNEAQQTLSNRISLPVSRSMGNLKTERGKNHTPSNISLTSSSTDEEEIVEQPIYENELQPRTSVFGSEPLYSNEIVRQFMDEIHQEMYS